MSKNFCLTFKKFKFWLNIIFYESVFVTTLFLLVGAIKNGKNHMSPGLKRHTAHAQIPLETLHMRSNSYFHYGFNFFPKLHRFNSTTSTQFFNAFSFLQKILHHQGYWIVKKSNIKWSFSKLSKLLGKHEI